MAGARPHVTLHFAQSLDGRIALDGARARMSSAPGIESAHRARAESDAVLVGSRTVTIDDPRLTVRVVTGPQPIRVVLSSRLALPEGARLLTEAEGGPLVVVGAEGRAEPRMRAALEARGASVLVVAPDAQGQVSLPHALHALRERGVERLLVEGGARVITSFLRDRLVDRVEIEIVPCWLGSPGLSATDALGVDGWNSRIRLEQVAVDRLGPHLLVRGEVVYPG